MILADARRRITTMGQHVPLSGGDLQDTKLLGRGEVDRTCDVSRRLHDALSIVQHSVPMNGSVIVWDLETVPDLRGFATLRRCPRSDRRE